MSEQNKIQKMKSYRFHVSDLKNKITLMKTLKINKLILLITGLVVFNGCVQDDDYSIPNTEIEEPVLDGSVIEISDVLGRLVQEQVSENDNQNPNPNNGLDYDSNVTFQYADGVVQYMEGYVVSTDEAGNFFEELILQDKPDNPTVGIKVPIDVNPLFTRYDIGRKVYIKVTNLHVGISNGVLAIGFKDGDFISKIPAALELETIKRSAEKAELVPLSLPLEDFDDSKTNLFINIPDVQFNRVQALQDELSFASEGFDEFDGERILESCSSSTTRVFSTSTFADFSGLNLPKGRGNMDAILSKNFFGDQFNVVINTPEGIDFGSEENRCDPLLIECGLAASSGTNTLFEDNFETQTTFSPISGNGWTNYIESGTEAWEAYTQGGTNSSQGVSARVGSFQSNDNSSIAWLITPQIDLDANNDVSIEFETSNSFSDGSTMDVLLSNDWDGTEAGIATATWAVLADAYVTQDSDFFGDWFSSGIVDLSCETGQVYIAFKYSGSGQSDFDGTYELDNIRISSN